MTRSQLDAHVRVGKKKDNRFAYFSMLTEIYQDETEIEYANETLLVPSGGFEFSVNITDWPWKDGNTDNGLSFGVRLNVNTRQGRGVLDKPDILEQLQGNFTVERLDFGDGMFIDSPTLCIVDDNSFADVSTTTVADGDDDQGIAIDWIFPHFDTVLYYDPIMGDTSSVNDGESEENDNVEYNFDIVTQQLQDPVAR